jgi:hypothetical protein
LDECKVSTWSTKGFPNCIIGPPHPVDNCWDEGLRSKKEKGTVGECLGKGSSNVGNLVVDDRVEVGDCCNVSKKHVDKGAVALHMSFAPCAYAIMGRVKSKDEMGKYLEVHISHSAVVA